MTKKRCLVEYESFSSSILRYSSTTVNIFPHSEEGRRFPVDCSPHLMTCALSSCPWRGSYLCSPSSRTRRAGESLGPRTLICNHKWSASWKETGNKTRPECPIVAKDCFFQRFFLNKKKRHTLRSILTVTVTKMSYCTIWNQWISTGFKTRDATASRKLVLALLRIVFEGWEEFEIVNVNIVIKLWYCYDHIVILDIISL